VTDALQGKHTPGPWEVKRSGSGYPYQVHAPNGNHVKDVTRWASISVPSLPEGEANARLIAAAPDLLAIVRAVDGHHAIPADSHLGERIRAAIAKATGETP
jgi:hypothetical protein